MMPLSPEHRLVLLGLPPEALTPELQALVADWAARCDRIRAHAKAELDPFILPIPATLSPIGAPRAVDWPPYMLGQDSRDGKSE
jgi:hypothetical protein